MSLQLTGTVKTILPLETGEGKNGQWKKQIFVISYMDGNYPKYLAVTGMGDRTDIINRLQPGQSVTIHFNVSSREYNGKYYTDCQAWKIEAGKEQSGIPAPIDEQGNDLPF